MKINYRQSGGFAGIVKSCQLATTEMDPANRQALQELVEEADLKDAPTPPAGNAPDTFMHDIRLEKDGVTQHLVVNDLSIPDKVRPLLTFLQKHAKIEGRHG